MHHKPELGIIGGSGLYQMNDLREKEEIEVSTPFGIPSAPIVVGTIEGHPIAFLARHGLGHYLTTLGVERIVSISACGSLREDYAPGEIVVPNQVFDFTHTRQRTFFGDGMVAHINVANPFCTDLSEYVYQSVKSTGINVHPTGSIITIEGPRFSTKAESNTFRSWGMSIINMTTSPEAFLAREAELCYAVMSHVTDYDVWHTSEEPVTVEMVIEILNRNTEIAQEAVRHLLNNLPEERNCGCSSALADALITDPSVIPEKTRQRLSLLVAKYLP